MFLAIVGITMGVASAAQKTTGKIYFKNSNYFVEKQVGPKTQDKIYLKYCSKNHNHKKDYGSPE